MIMRKIALLLFSTSLLYLGVSCNKVEDKKGTVTFGANYGMINCPTNVTIYIDDKKIGTLTSPAEEITECGRPENLTKDLSVGQHSYKVEIRSIQGSGCNKDLTGTISINENECTIVFINYLTIDF